MEKEVNNTFRNTQAGRQTYIDSQQEKVQITIQECCIKTCQQAVTKPKHGSSDGRAADYNPKAPGSSLCSGS